MGAIMAEVPDDEQDVEDVEPTRLPREMSGCLRKAATREAMSSGMEVPTATMVTPMRRSETPACAPGREAPSTNQPELNPSPAAPHDQKEQCPTNGHGGPKRLLR